MGQDAPPPPEHPLLAGMQQVEAGLDLLLAADRWSLPTSELCEYLDRVAAAEARLAAVKLAAVADADNRNIGVADATTTVGRLRSWLLMGPREDKQTVRLAQALRSDCPATGTALAAGTVTVEQAHVIVDTLGDLPPVDADVKVRAEGFLLGQAAVLDPVLLARAGRALRETLTTIPDADSRALRAPDRRELHLVPGYDAMVLIRGQLPAETAATVQAALHPLSAPRPAADGTPDPLDRHPRRRWPPILPATTLDRPRLDPPPHHRYHLRQLQHQLSGRSPPAD